jgi:hypothetical protein
LLRVEAIRPGESRTNEDMMDTTNANANEPTFATEFYVTMGASGAKIHPARTIRFSDGGEMDVLNCSCASTGDSMGRKRDLFRAPKATTHTCKGVRA